MCQRNRSNGETVTRSNEYLMKIKQYSHSLTTHDVSEFPQILGKCDSSLRSNNNDISAFQIAGLFCVSSRDYHKRICYWSKGIFRRTNGFRRSVLEKSADQIPHYNRCKGFRTFQEDLTGSFAGDFEKILWYPRARDFRWDIIVPRRNAICDRNPSRWTAISVSMIGDGLVCLSMIIKIRR
jgi:hypothetical protein